MSTTDVEIEIDGRTLTAKSNQTVIQVADDAGIYIPRFCYHKHLSIPANCRMCLVEVEKAPKALPACATPVMPGMKIFTKSAKTIAAQKAVMEFLLVNHPLDCPICDQGGECELQDLAMGYGKSQSQFNECKRSIADENLGPLIASDMTRCISCTRCVRFGSEIAGMRELGATFRGEQTEITTYIKDGIKSEVSGNIIDICPVGALTSKPYRFTARPFELSQTASISPHDCLGTHVYAHTRQGTIMRIVSRECSEINETWIADRDRFAYTSLNHSDRLTQPLMKINGEWQTVPWEKAFVAINTHLETIIQEHGAEQIGALASPSSTVEEFYLLQKIIRGLGSANIDHRLREVDVRDQANLAIMPVTSVSMSALEDADGILLIGSNLRSEQPLAALRVRKAVKKGAKVVLINSVDYEFNFEVAAKHIVSPASLTADLKALSKALSSEEAVNEKYFPLVKALADKKRIVIILGAQALHHHDASLVRHLAYQLADKLSAKLCFMTEGANAAGGWIAGAIPHRLAGGETTHQIGLSAYEMLTKPLLAYLLLNIEPEYDTANAALTIAALKQAKFVVAMSLYKNAVLDEHANIILPIAAYTETSGTYVNAMGEWQAFRGIAKPFADSRPAWKILRVLGHFLGLQGFEYASSEAVKEKLMSIISQQAPAFSANYYEPDHHAVKKSAHTLQRIGEVPIYAIDAMTRRAKPLQDAQVLMHGDLAVARIHPDTAKKFKLVDQENVWLKQEDDEILLPVKFDTSIAKDTIWIAAGIAETTGLGDLFGEVSIRKEVSAA